MRNHVEHYNQNKSGKRYYSEYGSIPLQQQTNQHNDYYQKRDGAKEPSHYKHLSAIFHHLDTLGGYTFKHIDLLE